MNCPNCSANMPIGDAKADYIRCYLCGVYFMEADPAQVAAHYRTGDYRNGNQQADEHAFQARRAAHIVQYVDKCFTHVDIGCSTGQLMRAVREKWNCESYGVDLDPVLTEGIVYADIADVPAQPDCVTMIHSLEHMPHPLAELRKVAGRMIRGGQIIIEVPNGDLKHPLEQFYRGAFAYPHVVMFDLPALVGTVEAAGFSVERAILHGNGGLDRAPAWYYLLVTGRKR